MPHGPIALERLVMLAELFDHRRAGFVEADDLHLLALGAQA